MMRMRVYGLACRKPRIDAAEEGYWVRLWFYGRPVMIVVIGLLLGCFVLGVTIDRNFAKTVPAVALAWNPGSADANVRLADALLQSSGIETAAPRIALLAERSLQRQPINPGAARLLAIVKSAQEDTPKAKALARYAEAMSRRDLPTQMWLIEAAVQRGDIATALIHYDRAMKTSAQGRVLLFPILIQAAADPAVWRPLAVVLAQRPQWWRSFVDQLVPHSPSADALYTIARKTKIEQAAYADPALLQAIEKRLVDLGAYRSAADLFNRAHGWPPNKPSFLNNGGFEQSGGWDPFEWNLQDAPDLAGVRQPSPRTGEGNALFITAANGRGGDVATQLVILAPGHYRLNATVGGVRGDPLAFPHLIMRCANNALPILDVPFPATSDTGRIWNSTLTIPSDCPAQRVVIRAGSSLDGTDSTPWVDNLAIKLEGH